jgi:hypothetical protein
MVEIEAAAVVKLMCGHIFEQLTSAKAAVCAVNYRRLLRSCKRGLCLLHLFNHGVGEF